jgi:hypothetical protein
MSFFRLVTAEGIDERYDNRVERRYGNRLFREGLQKRKRYV